MTAVEAAIIQRNRMERQTDSLLDKERGDDVPEGADGLREADPLVTAGEQVPVQASAQPICESILSVSKVAVMAFDHALRLVYFNEAARLWVGRYFEVELRLGLRVDEIFIRDHLTDFEECLSHALAGEAQQFHCCFLVGNVEERRFEVQFLPVAGNSGQSGMALIEVVQVASRIVLARSIIDQDELFRYLVQNSSDVMALLEQDGVIRYLSPSAEAVLGFPVDMLIGRKAQELVHPEDLETILAQNTSSAFVPGAQIAFSYRVQHADGSWIYLDSIATNLLHHPQIAGFVVNTRDVTERKMAEQVLAMEKEWLSVTLRSIGDAVITTDIKGRVAMINNTAEQLTGYTQKEAENRLLEEVYHVIDPATSERLPLPVEQMATRSMDEVAPPSDTECVLVSRDGSERLVSHSAAKIRDLDGKVIGMVVVFRDITDKQRMAEEIGRAQRLESVGVLAGGIAHDFNNILLAIINNVSLARARVADDMEVHGRLEDAERASLRARDLTRQLLTFSKGGAPVLNVHRLPGIIRESIEFVLHGSNIEVQFDIQPDLSAVEVDAGQISQVLNNLAINAMQAMPEGGRIKVSAHNTTLPPNNTYSLSPGGYVHISVEDNGPGIPRQIIGKLFDPFFTTKENGSGLGLAISYSILRSHKGVITVESVEGEGATFHILLPVTEKQVTEVVEEVVKPGRGAGRILLMDDDKDIRETMPLLLEGYGYEVDAVEDGVRMLAAYDKAIEEGRPYALVVMDLTVPGGMGGREAVAKLKQKHPEAQALVSSGYSNDSTMAEYRKFGFDGVVAKPYRVEELVRSIQQVL